MDKEKVKFVTIRGKRIPIKDKKGGRFEKLKNTFRKWNQEIEEEPLADKIKRWDTRLAHLRMLKQRSEFMNRSNRKSSRR